MDLDHNGYCGLDAARACFHLLMITSTSSPELEGSGSCSQERFARFSAIPA